MSPENSTIQMFQYEFEKRSPSAGSCDSRATMTTDWSRIYPNSSPSYPNSTTRSYPKQERTFHTDDGSQTKEQTNKKEERIYAKEDRSYPKDDRTYPKEDRTYPKEDLTYPKKERTYTKDDRSYPIKEPTYPKEQRPYPREERSYSREGRSYPSRVTSVCENVERARRPLPPRPIDVTLPTKTTVPLKVWIIASASCFAVCAALVLATVAITKWGTSDTYSRQQLYQLPEPLYTPPHLPTMPQKPSPDAAETTEADISLNSDELEPDLQFPILEKLSIFKNMVANREKNKRIENKKSDEANLVSKPQIHPIHDTSLHHPEKKIEKKDQAVYFNYPINLNIEESKVAKTVVPSFKPTLPELVLNRKDIKIMGWTGPNKNDVEYDEYYNDDNLYDDYMQSNTMTSYLIEKVQELHDWIVSDPDFNISTNVTKKERSGNEFGTILKALNESLIEGNVTIIMSKLKDIYFGENYTHANHTRKVVLSNSTDLLSFGILTLDVMLLHNIQIMAWENQESERTKMLKDPNVFAFNALFLEPNKVEARQNEVSHHHENIPLSKRPNLRTDNLDDFDIGKTILENVLEMGMSTARAAIHLGRAYKNTKNVLSQLSNRETLNTNIQNQISRNIDANTHALEHLQTSYSNSSAANTTCGSYTELDCVWLLYCKNLMATAKLNAPYGTMARINGMALRMLAGELSADRALDTMLYEALAGWTELRCTNMFPRCSKVDAASVVLQSILAPIRKTQSSTRS